jgi:hypothetical protein
VNRRSVYKADGRPTPILPSVQQRIGKNALIGGMNTQKGGSQNQQNAKPRHKNPHSKMIAQIVPICHTIRGAWPKNEAAEEQ